MLLCLFLIIFSILIFVYSKIKQNYIEMKNYVNEKDLRKQKILFSTIVIIYILFLIKSLINLLIVLYMISTFELDIFLRILYYMASFFDVIPIIFLILAFNFFDSESTKIELSSIQGNLYEN
jgi:hypothetical protein